MDKGLDNFLNGVKSYVEYWANLDKKAVEQGMQATGLTEQQYRCDGLAFSILVMLDGDSSINDFHRYKIFDGQTEINKGINLHEAFSNYRQQPEEE